jgi:hypothetical protein
MLDMSSKSPPNSMTVPRVARVACNSYALRSLRPLLGLFERLSGLLHKSDISKDSAIALIQTLAKNDRESDVRNAVRTVEERKG